VQGQGRAFREGAMMRDMATPMGAGGIFE